MRSAKKNHRSGTAVVELAICLPVLFILILGSIEICNLIFLKQAVTSAAYDGALIAGRKGTTKADVESGIQTVLAARGIVDADPSVETVGGDPIEDADPGDIITIEVRVPAAGNIPRPRILTQSRTITATVSGVRQ